YCMYMSYVYIHSAYLLSLPTRRSSDLAEGQASAVDEDVLVVVAESSSARARLRWLAHWCFGGEKPPRARGVPFDECFPSIDPVGCAAPPRCGGWSARRRCGRVS